MNKLIIASAAGALMLGISAPAFAQATPADCDNLFQRADVNKDGSLQADEAKVFIDAMNKAQVKPQDASMIKKDEFLAACQKNAFVDIKPETVGTAAATQPATTDQSQTSTATKTEQPATTTATTEQAQTGTATTEQPATTTTEQTAATQSTTTEQTTTTQPTEQALAAPEGFLASNIIGATVYSQDDQSIGDINDIILSPQGEPSQVIVGVGGFLGLGEKDVVLDMSKLKIAATESGKVKIVVQTTPEALKNMPAFTKKQ
jgi:ribosomal 30S subunit maturation factor RimM